MKSKIKFLLTTLFILVAFLLLGTTNVNATTLVGNEDDIKITNSDLVIDDLNSQTINGTR